MAKSYMSKLDEFVRVLAEYAARNAGVTETYTLATWADMVAECARQLAQTGGSAAVREAWANQDVHWRAVASGHRRAHNLIAAGAGHAAAAPAGAIGWRGWLEVRDGSN